MRRVALLLVLVLRAKAQPAIVSTAAATPFDLVIRSTVQVNGIFGTVLADLNGDGHPDLITAAQGFAVRLNDGTGNFSPAAIVYPYNSNSGGVYSIFTVADFNLDGRPDIVTVTNQGTYLYPGDGKGGLGPGQRVSIPTSGPPENIVAADFNGDGIPDLAMGLFGDGMKIYLGTGTGDFKELPAAFTERLPAPAGPSIQVADLNGDGFPDIVMMDLLPRTIAILMNDGTGHFHSTQVIQRGRFSRPASIAIGDFDKDGKPDLIIDYYVVPDDIPPFRQDLELWKQDNSGQFTLSSVIATKLRDPLTLDIADVDGDGNLDVIGGSASGTVVYFGDGKGGLLRTVTLPAAIGRPLIADLDGDGRPEIVTAGRQTVFVIGSSVPATRVRLTRDAPNPFTYGQFEYFTVNVAANPADTALPTGTVTLFDGKQLIGTVTLSGPAARFATRFTPGVHVLHAVYGGDAQYGPGAADLTVAEAGQSATIRALPVQTVFGFSVFSVVVRDAFGSPIRGAGVIFSAPAGGATGTFLSSSTLTILTDADGIATTPLFIPNNVAGSYNINTFVSGYPSVSTDIAITNLNQ